MKLKKISKKAIIIIVVAAIGIGTASWFGVANAAKENVPDTIQREYSVARGDITAGVSGQGTLNYESTPRNFREIVTIGELFVKQGQSVKTGDKLAQADEKKLNEAYEQALSELEKARIALKQAQSAKTLGELNAQKEAASGDAGNSEANSQIAQAQSTIDSLKQKISALDAQIAQTEGQIAVLLPDDPQTAELKARLEIFIKERDSAQAELSSAQGNLSSLEETKNKQEEAQAKNADINKKIANANSGSLNSAIELAKVDVELAQKKADQLKAIQEDTFLYADMDGVVLSLDAAPGSETKPDTPILTIGDPNKKRIVVPVPQSDIGKVKEGQGAEFMLDAFGDKKFTGKVINRSLVPIKESNPVSYGVTVEVDASDAEMLNGMTANVTLIIKQQKNVLQLSNKAILVKDGKQVVKMKNEDGTLREVEIKTGFSDGKVSEITTGLSEGDIVIVEG